MIDNKRLSWVHTRPTSETGFYNKYDCLVLTVYDYKASFVIEEIICEGGRVPRGHYRLFLEQIFQLEGDVLEIGTYASYEEAIAAAEEEYKNFNGFIRKQL